MMLIIRQVIIRKGEFMNSFNDKLKEENLHFARLINSINSNNVKEIKIIPHKKFKYMLTVLYSSFSLICALTEKEKDKIIEIAISKNIPISN